MSCEEMEWAFERAPRVPEDEGGRGRREDVPQRSRGKALPEVEAVTRRAAVWLRVGGYGLT
jgi:hypothetical protein